MTVWRPFIRVYMWQACIFWTCNCYKTRNEWQINSFIRRKKNCDILWYEFRIAIRYKFFAYCDIPIYRYIVTPLLMPQQHQNSKWLESDLDLALGIICMSMSISVQVWTLLGFKHVIIQLKYTIEGVSKILAPRDQIYFQRPSRVK